jgi:hypothetical protein
VNLPIAQRLALGATGLALLGIAVPAHPQEWAIYLYGQVDPIKASFYTEEEPWIFFRDDDSQYVFAVGCDHVKEVRRDNVPILSPACQVARAPTTTSQVYEGVLALELKHFEELMAKLTEQSRSYAQIVGTSAASGELRAGPATQVSRPEFERGRSPVELLKSEIDDTTLEIQLSMNRLATLIEKRNSYPPPQRQRFFFFSR